MKHILIGVFLAGIPLQQGFTEDFSAPFTLNDAIDTAIQNDPWLEGSQHREDALNSESISANTLPDPKVSLSAINFPTDTFDMDRESMAQLAVGVSQMFPRGDTLHLTSRQKQELATQEPLLRIDRKALVTANVAQLWLEAFKAQQSIALIEQDRSLFKDLVDVTLVNYSSALGHARQQDIIRAQLELTRLEDRVYSLHSQQESAQRQLYEWVGTEAARPLGNTLPQLTNDTIAAFLGTKPDPNQHYQQISAHPVMQAFDRRIEAMQTGVEIARQKYKPEWGVNAQYGYRDQDSQTGRQRSDLLTIGVNFDVPIFTGNRQDKYVSAASSKAEALKMDKLLLARQLMAQLEEATVRLNRLTERQDLYDQQLLPQMAEQAEASLNAYNNDDGDFAEAVRARIAMLNARIDALDIAVARQQTLAKMRYLLTRTDQEKTIPETGQ